ncbi:MAG: purine/pyrimidine permease [Clostridiales bacterium]|nr:purine/pyrimidine permease [Clostridiales bacterium]
MEQQVEQSTPRYGLDAKLSNRETTVYGLQHMIMFIANSSIMPVIIAKALGLADQEISQMLLRTFFLCGVLSIIQVRFGHRYPIIDGPSGMWLTVWINLAAVTSAMGGDLAELRASLQLGMVIAGVFVIVLGLSGKMRYISRLFSPLVNGVFLILMPIQLSKSMIQGMLGTVYGGDHIVSLDFIAFWVTVAVMVVINIFATPFLRSIAILIGVAAGWIFAAATGIGSFGDMSQMHSFFEPPQFFPWGTPIFDPGMVITCIIGSFLLFANVIASFLGTADAIGEEFSEKQLNRGTVCFGISTAMTGVFATIGFAVYATSMGIIRMTGVATRKPFYFGSAAMIILGVIGPVGLFFAAIPPAVGYGALLVLFAVIVKQGTDNFKKAKITERLGFVLGISMLTGTGIMMQPLTIFEHLPQIIVPFASNGLLVGVLLAIILEQAFSAKARGSAA